jgi:N-formylglutamate deformylase
MSRPLKLPYVISLPHCSGRIPEEVRPTIALTDEQIEESTDIGTEEIFGALPAKEVICAGLSRLAVDPNRGPHQRDAMGVVARVDYHGRQIYYPGLFPEDQEVERRIREYYWPYHNRLKAALDREDIKALFDCHSLYAIGPAEAPDAGKKRKDIVLSNNGDQSGDVNPGLGMTTCPARALHFIKQAFLDSGFSVSLNYPFTGGFITTHYGREVLKKGKLAVQIEINQALFSDPCANQLSTERLEDVKARVLEAFEKILSSWGH